MVNGDTALTVFSITSSTTYLLTVAGMIRAYGFKNWRRLGYGTGVDVEEIESAK